MRKTNTLLCLENIKQIFVYSIQTDYSRASEFGNSCSSYYLSGLIIKIL